MLKRGKLCGGGNLAGKHTGENLREVVQKAVMHVRKPLQGKCGGNSAGKCGKRYETGKLAGSCAVHGICGKMYPNGEICGGTYTPRRKSIPLSGRISGVFISTVIYYIETAPGLQDSPDENSHFRNREKFIPQVPVKRSERCTLHRQC